MFAVVSKWDIAPARLVHIPLLCNSGNLTDAAGSNDVAHGKRIGLAAMLSAHLHNLLRGLHRIAGRLRFFEYVGERLFDVAVFAGLDHFDAKLRVLEISGR